MCKGMEPKPDPWEISQKPEEKNYFDDEEEANQFVAQPGPQQGSSYIRELQIENGKFRQGIILRNKKIKLLENALQAKDSQLKRL